MAKKEGCLVGLFEFGWLFVALYEKISLIGALFWEKYSSFGPS
jgi:hypothetical protein